MSQEPWRNHLSVDKLKHHTGPHIGGIAPIVVLIYNRSAIDHAKEEATKLEQIEYKVDELINGKRVEEDRVEQIAKSDDFHCEQNGERHRPEPIQASNLRTLVSKMSVDGSKFTIVTPEMIFRYTLIGGTSFVKFFLKRGDQLILE